MGFITLHDVTMKFGSNVALDDVTLDIVPGEVHGLLGHNGSGKSTLIRVLAGVYSPDDGRLSINGTMLPLPIAPDVAARHGLAFVHQGLGLADGLSVLDNLAVSGYERARFGRISWQRQRMRAESELRKFGLDIDVDRLVSDLEPVEQAIVGICRAMAAVDQAPRPRLLVLDEPTVYLPRPQVETLFAAIRELVATGDSVLFVSHRIEEVLRYTDRVTVLRNGRRVATENTAGLDERHVVRLIVGRDLEEHRDAVESETQGTAVARVAGLSGKHIHDVAFSVAAGEVLGLTGLAGSGFNEVPYLLYGAQAGAKGRLEVMAPSGEVRPLELGSLTPRKALANNIVLVPADRARRAVVSEASVRENVALPAITTFFRTGLLRPGSERGYVRRLVDQFDVRLPSLEAPMSQLSGGNQQKSVLAKWLSQQPLLVLMDEPTQGVDVAGRFEIWGRLREVAASGAGVIIASESPEELAELCDRVLVFRDGRISRQLSGASMDKHAIADAMLAESPAAMANES